MRKRLLSLLLFVVAGLSAVHAYDFSVVVPSGQTLYFSISSSNTVNVVWPNSNATDIANIYDGYTEPTGNLVIPSSVTHNGTTYTVTAIGTAFANCEGLTSVTIPNSVTYIGATAFYGCSGLTSVTIPNSVTYIGDYAFYDCTGLTSVTIPNSVTSIGETAFWNCSGLTTLNFNAINCGDFSSQYHPFYNCPIATINIGDSVQRIPAYFAYGRNALTSITIPNSVTSIGDEAFHNCSGLTSVTIPNSVTSIGYGAFYNVRHIIYNGTATGSPWGALSVNGYVEGDFVYADNTKTSLLVYIGSDTNVTIPNSVTSIGEYAFYDCSGLTSVTIPNSVTSIGDYAFVVCSGLTSVTIPNSVTSIGFGAFAYCSGLTSVTIGNSVTTIGEYAFSGCSNLRDVTSLAVTPPTLGTTVFSAAGILKVPCGSENSYSSNASWSQYFDDINEMCNLTITVTSVNDSMGTVLGGGEYDFGSPATIAAIPNEGYRFVTWNDGNTDNPRTITVTEDATYIANFATEGTTTPDSNTIVIYDTIYINIHDTTYITQIDTVTNTVYDTITNTIYDTTYVPVHDTTYITQIDTITNTVYDTVTNTVYDTVTNTIYDTIDNFVYDTVYITETDTLWLFDTIYMHDTIYIYDTIYIRDSTTGIEDVSVINAKIYSSRSRIVVEGADGNSVMLFDMQGRLLSTKQDEYSVLEFEVPISGAYFVKIGNYKAKKVVVIK